MAEAIDSTDPTSDLSGGERRKMIRSIILAGGEAQVVRLAADFAVSVETIRRDLKALEDEGFVTRVYGGARAATGYVLPHIDMRIGTDRAAKERIARLALSLIEPGMSVFFSGGSTVLALAWLLREGPRIDATTVMIDIGVVLASGVQTNVCLCGGQLSASSRACTGFEAMEMISRRSFDLAFLGASGIDAQRGLLGRSEVHLQLAQVARAQSRRVAAMIPQSSMKSGERLQILNLSQLDYLITDRPPEPALFRGIEAAGGELLF
ncbi:DeoR/GlpR transcriptional regulator [Xinfangfangia sp. D13-10-4-6]|uniref:DeoR/GlpR family DNA-binding transcription regulator n=1 Tax=Pseudogemmobacter hezensis TaxID=2737662 RepID=UPI0015550AE7|nr:DeoR/GlpR family DNA-binding transcription regulator [Pseudogemmobacter hezensis]NPD17411.1 DeoR/GlpR transcriptional regulator [Pseudogemmobacter hezensis]